MNNISNHYNWLDKHFSSILILYGQNPDISKSLIISFGVAVYLLSYLSPFDKTVRQTENGWVDPKTWVVKHYFEDFVDTIRHKLEFFAFSEYD